MSGAVPGRVVVLEVVVVVVAVVEEAGLVVRGTAGFFSGAVPLLEDGVVGLALAAAVRDAAVVVVVEAELRAVVFVLVVSAAGELVSILLQS